MNISRLRTSSVTFQTYSHRQTRLLASFSRPAPPPLPPKQQREFEELVRAAATPATAAANPQQQNVVNPGTELHPDARRAPPPEFEGDTNPETGEIGGPKSEPVRHGDWSFGGRASDF